MKAYSVRRLLCFAALILVFTAVSVPAYADYSIPSYLRIGLFYGTNSKIYSVTVSSENGFYFGTYSVRIFRRRKDLLTEMTVSFEGGGIVAKSKWLCGI